MRSTRPWFGRTRRAKGLFPGIPLSFTRPAPVKGRHDSDYILPPCHDDPARRLREAGPLGRPCRSRSGFRSRVPCSRRETEPGESYPKWPEHPMTSRAPDCRSGSRDSLSDRGRRRVRISGSLRRNGRSTRSIQAPTTAPAPAPAPVPAPVPAPAPALRSGSCIAVLFPLPVSFSCPEVPREWIPTLAS